jgi:LacI family transcriptional regulator
MPVLTKKITIRDIAQKGAISVSTVSGILSGRDGFSEATQKRVWDIANSLNYTPNKEARKLRSGGDSGKREKTGIIIHISHLGSKTPLDSEFEAQRTLMMGWKAENHKLFSLSYWYYKYKGFQCPPVLNGHVDGAIVGTPHLEVVNILRDKIPMVLMDVPFSQQNANVPMVNMDYRYGFNELMTMLKENGHEKVGTVHSTNTGDAVLTKAPVFKAIRDAAELAEIKLPEEYCIARDINPDNHDVMMKKVTEELIGAIKEKKISAIICSGNSCAVSLYENLKEAGFKIPEDVSIATLYSGMKSPQYNISSAMYDWEGLIDTSLDVLKNLIDNKTLSCREFLVPSSFFKGQTIGKI